MAKRKKGKQRKSAATRRKKTARRKGSSNRQPERAAKDAAADKAAADDAAAPAEETADAKPTDGDAEKVKAADGEAEEATDDSETSSDGADDGDEADDGGDSDGDEGAGAKASSKSKSKSKSKADASDSDSDDDGADDDSGDGGDDDGGDDDDDADDDGELPKRGEPWGWPLARLDRRWTWLETRVLFFCLMLLTTLLCLWFAIRGMKEPLTAKESAGTLFRALVGAMVLGSLTRVLTRARLEEQKRNIATAAAVVVGLLTAKLWRHVGIEFFAGMLDWLQEGSTLTLFGGLKGISTRLTMTVALIGASLAAATGTHINIDVVVRFIPKRWRKLVNILGGVATASICIAVAIGFADFVAVTGFGANMDATPGEKVSKIQHEVGEHFFLWRKQAKLDIGAIPYVFSGDPWNSPERFNGRQWNEFLDNEGFVERYGAEKVNMLRAEGSDLDESRTPFVAAPHGHVRGALVHSMDLIFPFGFFMIGLRFLLRSLLVLSGFISVEEQEGEDEDDEDSLDEEAAAEGAV